MSYGQEPSEQTTKTSFPQSVQHLADHIDQPRMQAIVAMSVLGGLGVTVMAAKAIGGGDYQSDEERQAAKNTAKFFGLGALSIAAFYLLDIDRKWWHAEQAIEEAQRWIEGRL